MMTFLRKRLVQAAITAAAALLFAAAPGCQTEARSTKTETTAGPDGREGHAESMADSDAERAKKAAERNRNNAPAERPAAPNDRSGMGVVDQPVGGRP